MGGLCVLVPLLAMFVSGVGVLFRLVVLAEIMMERGLMMVMGSGMVMAGSPMMMLARWMLSHGIFLPNRFLKMDAGCNVLIDIIVPAKL